MSNRSTEFAGQSFELHPSGALFWRQASMLVLGDLHLEKATSYHRSGQFLPPYDTAQTLAGLAAVIAETSPERLLFLGDVFHDGAAWSRMAPDDRKTLAEITGSRGSIWVEGNHDQCFVPPGHSACAEHVEAGLVFRHIMNEADPRPEISAHYHPAGIVSHRGARLRRPCFVQAGTRFMLPAFGVLTGGLDCRDPALAALHGRATQLFLLGEDSVFAPPPGLAPDPRHRRRSR
ncbi:MAG: ligase-associated DNA damage response endonuclease PdeM [Pseudomonadota bacterium]|nr:ligase-associated DNA damage response endonuclease PdeM [Pseudomonadota bacterium]